MIKRFSSACALVGLTAALMFAQGPGPMEGGGPPDQAGMGDMRVKSLITALELTEAQQTKATAIFSDANTASRAVRSNLKTNRTSLSEAVKNNDTEAIDKLAAAIGTLTGQITAIDSKAEAALYSILTPDQRTLYSAMQSRGPGGPGRGGPGGFGDQPSPPPPGQ